MVTEENISVLQSFTKEEYLAFERGAFEWHEYNNGKLKLRAASCIAHAIIQMNFLCEVGIFLKGKNHHIFNHNLRIFNADTNSFFYADAQIVSGDMQMLDEENDNILNPSVIVEILSASTQSYDRGDKFMLYRSIATLKKYILVDSLSVKVEHFTRQPNENWLLKEYTSSSDTFQIQSINYNFPVAELYAGVEM